jgi:propanol-preferring alcohol dehydrogenase
MDYNLIYGERSIQSVANMTRKDAVELLKLAGDIPIRTEVSTFSLAEANKVLRLLKESKIKGTAVLSLE